MKCKILHPVILTLVVFLFSCSGEKLTYTLMYSPDEPFGKISETLETVIENNLNVEVNRVISEGSIANLDSLIKGTADFAIVENFIPFRDSIKTVLRLYPQILHIFYLADKEAQSFEEVFYDKEVFIGLPGSGSHRFMMILFEYFNLDMSRVNIVDNAFVNDVIAGFIDIIDPSQLIGLEAFKIYSFDDIEKYNRGSIVEGISLRYPQVYPFIIPSSTYGNITEKPIVTLATDAILVTRAGMRENPVYEVTRHVFNEKQDFTRISPLIQRGLDEKFDRSQLSFPLHEGARVFFDRDEPSVFEKYAELFGVIFSISVALVSALISLTKWQSQKKKDRVDVFYRELMKVKNEMNKLVSSNLAQERLKEILASQNRAFDMLINEELEANDSFRIYMELSKETIHELRVRIKSLKSLNR